MIYMEIGGLFLQLKYYDKYQEEICKKNRV